jgi:hypothetical protein
MALTITGSLTVSGSLKTGISNVDDSLIFAIDPSNPRSYVIGSIHIFDLVRYRKNSSPNDAVTGSVNNGVGVLTDTGSIVSLDFDGTDDHISFVTDTNTAGTYTFPLISTKGTRGGIPGASTGFTIVTHMKWTTAGGAGQYQIVQIRDGRSGEFPRGSISLSINWIQGGKQVIKFGGTDPYGAAFTQNYDFGTAGTFPKHKWHDVTMVATHDGSTGLFTLYIDGVQVDQYSNTNTNLRPYDFDTGVSIDIGNVPGIGFINPLQFQLGGFYVHDRSFSAAEVKQNFDAYNGRFNFNT